MTSIRSFAIGRAADPVPDDGIETVLGMRDRLNALIACGEGATPVTGRIAVDGRDVTIAEYAVMATELKAQRLDRAIAASSTYGELLDAYRAMTPEEQRLELAMRVPGRRGGKLLRVAGIGPVDDRFMGICGSPSAHLRYVDTPDRHLRMIARPHVTPEMIRPDRRVLLRTSSSENTDALAAFRVSDMEIVDGRIVLTPAA